MQPPLTELLARIRNIQPMPQVALRVLELSQRSDVVPRELVDVIQTEPALTAKVLRLVNSAYYGFKRQIASLGEAGNLLGTGALVNVVLTGCGARYFHECPARNDEERATRWRRSVSCALATSLLAKVTHAAEPGRAYTAALLQDLGELVLAGLPRSHADELDRRMAAGTPRLDAEEQVYGLTHAEVGARLATRWNFPELLIDTLRYHHAPERATVDPALASLVNLGASVVDDLESDTRSELGSGLGSGLVASPTALALLGVDLSALATMHAPLQRELERARDFIEAA